MCLKLLYHLLPGIGRVVNCLLIAENGVLEMHPFAWVLGDLPFYLFHSVTLDFFIDPCFLFIDIFVDMFFSVQFFNVDGQAVCLVDLVFLPL